MSNKSNASMTDALIEALEQDEEYDGRVRGDEIGRPGYFLKEIPVPGRGSGMAPSPAISQSGASAAVPVEAPEAQISIVHCPSCGADNTPGAKYCNECGHNLSPGTSSVGQQPQRARAQAGSKVTLVSINEDGSDGLRVELEYQETVVGRSGDIRFPTDAFLSPKHARLTVEGNKIFIEDLYSLNGTYLKLREEIRLTPGDTFLMGRQVLRFERFEQQIVPKARSSDGTRYMGSPPPGGQYKLLQVGIGGIVQNVYCLPDTGAIVGREKGDVIFPRDKFMSSRHAQVFPRDDNHYYLVDLNSSNGTWVKIWERRELNQGDFVFLGQQLFRLEFG